MNTDMKPKRDWYATTFRLKPETVAEADTIDSVLALGTRTSAVQYAVRQIYLQLVATGGDAVKEEMATRLAAIRAANAVRDEKLNLLAADEAVK